MDSENISAALYLYTATVGDALMIIKLSTKDM